MGTRLTVVSVLWGRSVVPEHTVWSPEAQTDSRTLPPSPNTKTHQSHEALLPLHSKVHACFFLAVFHSVLQTPGYRREVVCQHSYISLLIFCAVYAVMSFQFCLLWSDTRLGVSKGCFILKMGGFYMSFLYLTSCLSSCWWLFCYCANVNQKTHFSVFPSPICLIPVLIRFKPVLMWPKKLCGH